MDDESEYGDQSTFTPAVPGPGFIALGMGVVLSQKLVDRLREDVKYRARIRLVRLHVRTCCN